jgi:signal transduction histidine kinase
LDLQDYTKKLCPEIKAYDLQEITKEILLMANPKEVREKIFKPFFTTKSKRQGFGLAVCKRLMEAQNSTITFSNENGEGTTFTITLPAA